MTKQKPPKVHAALPISLVALWKNSSISENRLARLTPFWPLFILVIALAWRLIVLASNSVTFHSDEAIVGLMARHINQGLPAPTFFYGQPYMGSLDPLLVAGMFRIAGSSVLSIRIVQSMLYLGIVGTLMLLTYRLTQDRWTTIIAGLMTP